MMVYNLKMDMALPPEGLMVIMLTIVKNIYTKYDNEIIVTMCISTFQT